MSRAALAAGLVALCAAPAPVLGLGAGDAAAARRGAAWLATAAVGSPGGQQADAIVAMAAAGRAPAELRVPLARLARVAQGYARTAGAAGKVAMAAVAAGADPARLGGVDYLARIRRAYAAGRFGASAFDQTLAMLALAAAGERVPLAAVSALRTARGAGGWGSALRASEKDDPTTTGLVIEAARAAGVSARDPMLRGAAAWLLGQRNAEGGWAFPGPGSPTEANSTAIAVRALISLGRRPPPASVAALRRLQAPDGGVAFRVGDAGSRLLATVDAVPALAGRALPPPFAPG